MRYLNDLVIKVEDISQMINFAMRLVGRLEDHPSLQESYTEDVELLIEEYNKEVFLLKSELERYFELEKRNNLPINLSLRKAYESLRLL